MLSIVWEDDEGSHREPLDPAGNRIGRSLDSSVRLAHISVSRQQAKL